MTQYYRTIIVFSQIAIGLSKDQERLHDGKVKEDVLICEGIGQCPSGAEMYDDIVIVQDETVNK